MFTCIFTCIVVFVFPLLLFFFVMFAFKLTFVFVCVFLFISPFRFVCQFGFALDCVCTGLIFVVVFESVVISSFRG